MIRGLLGAVGMAIALDTYAVVSGAAIPADLPWFSDKGSWPRFASLSSRAESKPRHSLGSHRRR